MTNESKLSPRWDFHAKGLHKRSFKFYYRWVFKTLLTDGLQNRTKWKYMKRTWNWQTSKVQKRYSRVFQFGFRALFRTDAKSQTANVSASLCTKDSLLIASICSFTSKLPNSRSKVSDDAFMWDTRKTTDEKISLLADKFLSSTFARWCPFSYIVCQLPVAI